MGNLKPAPFFLNERTVGAVLADRPGPAVVHVPFEGALVDRPREAEEDPLQEPGIEHFPSPDWPDEPPAEAPLQSRFAPLRAQNSAPAMASEPCWRCGAARGCSHRETGQ